MEPLFLGVSTSELFVRNFFVSPEHEYLWGVLRTATLKASGYRMTNNKYWRESLAQMRNLMGFLHDDGQITSPIMEAVDKLIQELTGMETSETHPDGGDRMMKLHSLYSFLDSAIAISARRRQQEIDDLHRESQKGLGELLREVLDLSVKLDLPWELRVNGETSCIAITGCKRVDPDLEDFETADETDLSLLLGNILKSFQTLHTTGHWNYD